MDRHRTRDLAHRRLGPAGHRRRPHGAAPSRWQPRGGQVGADARTTAVLVVLAAGRPRTVLGGRPPLTSTTTVASADRRRSRWSSGGRACSAPSVTSSATTGSTLSVSYRGTVSVYG
ncbi:hypothetical protein [Streptomyces antibioticus]|uniref:hypothetical protein n=1 Tax=Streptomyces antibioticus TaxID=1890 RepID=UPI0033BB456A